MDGVNYELGPVLHMSAPAEWANLHFADWAENRELFTSKITLFGFIPFDSHQFRFKATHVTGFHENSRNIMNSLWEHRRELCGDDSTTTVTDRVSYESKIGVLGYLMYPIYRAVFRYRHRRLKTKYGK